MAIVYTYPISTTLNNKVNFEKLKIEVLASETPNVIDVTGVSGEIYVKVEDALTAIQVDNATLPNGLNQIIAAHDGKSADITDSAVNSRELAIRKLGQMASFHPMITKEALMFYLTDIDNYLNSWKRMGFTDVVIPKISTDAADTNNSSYAFLNIPVNSSGALVWQFLVQSILDAS